MKVVTSLSLYNQQLTNCSAIK